MILSESWGDRFGEWQVKETAPGLCLTVGFRVREDKASRYTSEAWRSTEC